MTRARMINVGGVAAAAVLAGQVAAHLATLGQGPRVIENKGQALPKGAQRAIRDGRAERKARDRAAAMELQRISNQTLVVAHLHPRWLRMLTEKAMDGGQHVTWADVERWRAQGKTLALIGLRLIEEEDLD